MSKKRDYVDEITSRRQRLRRRAPRFQEVSSRVEGLIDISNFVKTARASEFPFREELAKYIPIGMVACIEGYFRMVFRDLIDHGSPFRENVAKFKDIRLGVDHVLALQSRKITFGEFVAHLLPTNGLDDLADSVSTLIGEPFLERLKNTKADYFVSGELVSLEEEGLTGAVFRDVKTLFEQRHIFAHEIATKARVSPRRLATESAGGLMLIWGTETIVSELLSASI